MKQGNWVPLSKAFVSKLPFGREYSELEAMFSIAVDYDNNSSASIAGYAALWGWSRKKVSNFLKKYGLEITYADKFDRHKKGQVGYQVGYQVGNRKGTGRGQVEFIDSKVLRIEWNRKGAGEEQEGDRKGNTTIKPNPNPQKNTLHPDGCSKPDEGAFYLTKKGKKLTGEKLESFNRFWKAFSYKSGKAEAADAWLLVYSPDIVDQIVSGAQHEAERRPAMVAAGRTPKMAQGWLSGRRWEDEQLPPSGRDCKICRYNQTEPCANLSRPAFDPAGCDSYQPVPR